MFRATACIGTPIARLALGIVLREKIVDGVSRLPTPSRTCMHQWSLRAGVSNSLAFCIAEPRQHRLPVIHAHRCDRVGVSAESAKVHERNRQCNAACSKGINNPGKGLSSSTINVVWGFFNLLIAWLLIFRVGAFDLHDVQHALAFGVGMLLMFLMSAYVFGPSHGGR